MQFDWPEGPAEGPAQARSVSIDPAGSTLNFTVPGPAARETYTISGKITTDAVVLEQWDWGDGKGPYTVHREIPRVETFPKVAPPCKEGD